jgi:phage terminase small subunit
MSKELTLKQRKFIQEYKETGNKAESVIRAGYNIGGKHGTNNPRVVASKIGCENVRKPAIKKELEGVFELVERKMQLASIKAQEQVEQLSQTATKEEVRLDASQDILDRTNHLPKKDDVQPTTINIIGAIPRPQLVQETTEILQKENP